MKEKMRKFLPIFMVFKLVAIFALGVGSTNISTTLDVKKTALDDVFSKDIATNISTSKNELTKNIKVSKAKVEEVYNNPVIHYVNNTNNNNVKSNGISIPGALNNVLMKDTNGSHFYLNHNLNGVYDGRGVPYIDYRTDFTTRKTIIYAHSSTTGNGPFQALQNYHNNPGYYNSHRYINITYNGKSYRYLIFSVYVSLADNDYSEGLEYFRNINYSDSNWANTIQKYKNNSEYNTGVEVNGNDKILILQTCSMDRRYYEKYYRYNLLIMAKQV